MSNNNVRVDAEPIVLIDEDNLDKECIRLPSNYLQCACNSADAKREVDELKAELDVIEADLSRKIRADPARYGIEKLTEGGLGSTVILQKSYREALKNLQEARYQHDLHQAVVNAMEHKKRSLTLLVELLGLSYYSSPKVSEKGRDAVETMTKKKVRHFRDED